MAIFDNNMAVVKSENLVTLHPHDLTQPFLRGCSDLESDAVSFAKTIKWLCRKSLNDKNLELPFVI